jgi:NAD(P) transhydrogenase subunit alpha
MADAASSMPVDASRLYAKNVTNLLALALTPEAFVLDLDDAVLDGTCIVHDGVVRHAPTAALLEA